MTQVWPGSAYPLGATYDGTGTNFAIFSEVAEKVELCLFDDEGNEERGPLPEMDGYVWHAFLPGIHPGQRARLRTAPTTPPRACAATRTSCCSTRTPRPSTVRSTGTRRSSATTSRRRSATTRTCGAHAEVRRRQPVLRLGRRPAAEDAVPQDGHLRGPRQGPDDDQPAHPRGAARHLRRGRAPGDDRVPAGPRDHRDRAHAGAPVRAGRHPPAEGPAQLLGLQHDRLLRAAQRVRQQHHRRAARAGVQGHGPRAARGGHRGHPRRGLQPHRRGQPHGPTLSFKGIDNRTYYRLVEDDKQHYMDYTGTGKR